MAYSESPIFPGKVKNGVASLAASTAASYTILSDDSTYPQIVNAISIFNTLAGTAAVARLVLSEAGTDYELCKFSFGGVAETAISLLSSAYMPWVNDNQPEMRLAPGQSLKIVVVGTTGPQAKVVVFGGTYEAVG